MQIQLMAPAMEKAASFGSQGVMEPSSMPSWRKESQAAINLSLVAAHFGARFGREFAVVQPYHRAAEVYGDDFRVGRR